MWAAVVCLSLVVCTLHGVHVYVEVAEVVHKRQLYCMWVAAIVVWVCSLHSMET